jgi:NAD(P)-dependent dehydrogenase (short-subunit alcohol dehydrogenase family)
MFSEIDERVVRLDVLVNNAGIAGSYGTLDSYSVSTLEHLWAVNLTGPFVCAREAARRMRAGGHGGSIINIASKAAVLGGPNEWVHYAASKGAIDTMTIGLAKAGAGQSVNAASRSHRERFPPHDPGGSNNDPVLIQRPVHHWRCRSRGIGLPAASYVTGAFIEVTGGCRAVACTVTTSRPAMLPQAPA